MINGIVVINKAKGDSSAQVVSKIKKIVFNSELPYPKPLKVGHFGTLDPEAEGVLPIALGRATRLFNYHLEDTKTYYAKFVFGFTTDTLDLSGNIIETTQIIPSVDDIKRVSKQLEGVGFQLPPKYSAKLINGQRAYSLARKGVEFDLKPKKITIEQIQFLDENSCINNNNEFAFKIICSAGTYIRSIARDMAHLLGTKGTMSFLRRERSGCFDIKHSISIDEFKNNPEMHIIPIEKFISFPKIPINDEQFVRIRNGMNVEVELAHLEPKILYSVILNDKIVGIGFVFENQLKIKTWLV
ncbi:MAG TPA: tRNA pseudouridine(55) synthase TruB [Clostridia bacterium]|jgi:tRNA pseudouridine55 synthase|nr:tRNA pseudouridine(55) synthase TruB [Clostridia bacterium]